MKSLLPLRTKTNGFSAHVLSLVILLVCLVAAGWLVLNRQYALDQVTIWQYHPSGQVQGIASRAQMNDQGRFYFYASQPEVDEATAFNKQCKKQEEHSAILGCYTARRIYIYDVSDTRLDGIKEVTAAHEMLHAAWDRLSDQERERLKQLLTAQYNKIATPELEERMAYYDRTQPGEGINELHSILGTEVVNLDKDLEQYYSKYFTNRKQVATLHQQYQHVFDELDTKAKTLSAELQQFETDIQTQLVSYDARRAQLEQQSNNLESQAKSVDQSSAAAVQAYNSEVNEFNNDLANLRADYANINNLIATYNQKVAEYNKVALSQLDLQKSIDSSQVSAPAI